MEKLQPIKAWGVIAKDWQESHWKDPFYNPFYFERGKEYGMQMISVFKTKKDAIRFAKTDSNTKVIRVLVTPLT